MIPVPASLIQDLQVIADTLEEGNVARAFQLLVVLLQILEAEPD